MPGAGEDRVNFHAAASTFSTTDLGGEFIFEDDGSPLPDITNNFNDNAIALEANGIASDFDPEGFAALLLKAEGPSSPPLTDSPGSLSDSSSKRTTSTALTNGDVMMTDACQVKTDLSFAEFVNADDDRFCTDVNMNTFSAVGAASGAHFFFSKQTDGEALADLDSSGINPGLFFGGMDDAPGSPSQLVCGHGSANTNANAGQTPVDASAQGHTRSQSTGGAIFAPTRNGTREGTPFSMVNADLNHSQDSSPSSFAPSPPTDTYTFGAGQGAFQPQWSGPPGLNGLQASPTLSHMMKATPPALGQQTGFSQALYSSTGPYQLVVKPLTAHKSRVETQIPVKLVMNSLPFGVKKLHLPRHTISKAKLMAKPAPKRSPGMLELHTTLVCTSAMRKPEVREQALRRARKAATSKPKTTSSFPNLGEGEELKPQDGGDVQICEGCKTRERKRAGRKKVKKPEEEEVWMQDEHRRVIVFNTHEIKDWVVPPEGEHGLASTGFEIDAPMRIACYCRHHGEKLGFQVIFTITDDTYNLVAQCLSHTIMITDDHKTHTTTVTLPEAPPGPVPHALAGQHEHATCPDRDASLSPPGGPFHVSSSTSDLQAVRRNSAGPSPVQPHQPLPADMGTQQGQGTQPGTRQLSRPASPTAFAGPSCKKRKASNTPAKLPSGLMMTRLDGPQTLGAAQSAPAQPAPSLASPFSPAQMGFSPESEHAGGVNQVALPVRAATAPSFSTGSSPAAVQEQNLFSSGGGGGGGGGGGAVDGLNQAALYSAPVSNRASRAPSPNCGLMAGPSGLMQPNGSVVQAVANSLSQFHGLPMAVNAMATPRPTIYKIIPSEGPKCGGIEVTVLGADFSRGLEVMFGDMKAPTTTYWGETSLVCLLPPSPIAGTVQVTFKHQLGQSQPLRPLPTFKYVDDDEQQLMRTALAVLYAKMSGSFEDTTEIARRILGDHGSGWAGVNPSNGNSGGPSTFHGFSVDFEAQLMKVLELIDLDDSMHKPRYNLRRASHQTMLHLGCSLGLHRFVSGLLARGALPDLQDLGGYTPLHLAALNDHAEIVRRLIYHGADPTIRTLRGDRAADVATSKAVLHALKRVERRVRSHSRLSLHSRASSASSLKSLWETHSRPTSEPVSSKDESDSAEASVEARHGHDYDYDSDSNEGEDSDEDDGRWLDMRRSSVHLHETRVPDAVDVDAAGPYSGLVSPAAAVHALREQFSAQVAQLQQTMTLHFQNLRPFTALPQMPYMPPLLEYQAAMQRLAAMVPNIGGSLRPFSAADAPPPPPPPPHDRDLDSKWWDLSSLMTTAAPPPPYEDIFPPRDLTDKKVMSAAQAAAEAEADKKCIDMYDTPATTNTVTTASSQTVAPPSAVVPNQKLPALLEIGRKNSITREQQENLRRAHAERMKRLGRDRNLFFIWIPLLVVVMCAMLYHTFPSVFASAWSNRLFIFSAADRAAVHML